MQGQWYFLYHSKTNAFWMCDTDVARIGDLRCRQCNAITEDSEKHVITVTGKAFFDVDHASADHLNRRIKPKKYAVWEIHPVMALHVDQ